MGCYNEPVDISQAVLCLDLGTRHPDCWPIKYFGEKKFPRELIFGKRRSFHLFSNGKDFQEKSEKLICNDNQIENQTKLSLQKISKNVQNL